MLTKPVEPELRSVQPAEVVEPAEEITPALEMSTRLPVPLFAIEGPPLHDEHKKKNPLMLSITELAAPVFTTVNVTVFTPVIWGVIESANAAVLIIRSITAVKTRNFFIFDPLSELVWKRRSGPCLQSDLPPFPLWYRAIERPEFRFCK